MDWIFALAIGTFAIVVAFLLWNRASTKRHQETGGNTTGLGGPNDPLSGATEGIRDADTMRGSLDAAAGADAKPILHGKS